MSRYKRITFSGVDYFDKGMNRLKELEDMIESGLLIVSPCKIGSTLYIIHCPNSNCELIECDIAKMEFTGDEWKITLCASEFDNTGVFVAYYDVQSRAFRRGVSSDGVRYPKIWCLFLKRKPNAVLLNSKQSQM